VAIYPKNNLASHLNYFFGIAILDSKFRNEASLPMYF